MVEGCGTALTVNPQGLHRIDEDGVNGWLRKSLFTVCRSPGYLIHVSPGELISGKLIHLQLGQADPASSAKVILAGSERDYRLPAEADGEGR